MHTCAKFAPDRSSCLASFPHERERERERERIFIKINRNNDTIIIQCMDYTD